MMASADRTKSLEQLVAEGCEIGWDGPVERDYTSGLVHRCDSLYGIRLCAYSPGDLRVMIGQNIALSYLVPLALDVLSRDPMVEGDYFPEDLLAAVLRCGQRWPYQRFWEDNLPLMARLEEIIGRPRNDPEVREYVQIYWADRSLSVKTSAQAPQTKRKRR